MNCGLVTFLLGISTCYAVDVFMSMAGMKELVHTRRALFNVFTDVIRAEERKLQRLKRLVDIIGELDDALPVNFTENPINGYCLLKQLTLHRKVVEGVVADDVGRRLLKDAIEGVNQRFIVPTEKDFSGAAVSLLRLQFLYNLTSRGMVRGDVTGTSLQWRLDGSDCLRFAKICLRRKDFSRSIEWLQEAADILDRNPTEGEDLQSEIAEHATAIRYAMNNGLDTYYMKPLKTRLYAFEESHPRTNVPLSSTMNSTGFDEWLQKRDRGGFEYSAIVEDGIADEVGEYSTLCRGEAALHPSKNRKLHCHYSTNNSPYLYIQPVKTEVLHADPHVMLFHDIINHKTTEAIMNLARDVLVPVSTNIRKSEAPDSELDYRTASNAWLEESDHPAVAHVNQIVAAVTGLDMDTAEPLQVANYGLGGHYAPHFDDTTDQNRKIQLQQGQEPVERIATFMLYASDVTLGGATVFPNIGVAVQPRRGSAVFWYNRRRSGKLHDGSLHGGCPVLVGDKWVFNKWIHPSGQEFRRPCALSPDN